MFKTLHLDYIFFEPVVLKNVLSSKIPEIVLFSYKLYIIKASRSLIKICLFFALNEEH